MAHRAPLRVLLPLVLSAPVAAGTFAVTTTADGVPGSLRDALAQADASPGADTVLLPAGTYLLSAGSGGALEVGDPAGVVVEGAGAGVTRVDGGGTTTVFQVNAGALLTVRAATIERGASGAAFVGGNFNVDGHLVLEACTVRDGVATFGGGVRVTGSAGSVTVRGSTFVGNQGFGSAIESQQGDVSVANSTFTANAGGGGVLRLSNLGVLDLQNCTIVGNGSGLFLTGGSSTGLLASTILWDNAGGDLSASSTTGGWIDQGYNLVGDPAGLALGHPTTSTGLDPLLGPLAQNGGPTRTMLPRAGSPAIDAGANGGLFASDQRGPGFPRVLGAAADVGAVEASRRSRPAGPPQAHR